MLKRIAGIAITASATTILLGSAAWAEDMKLDAKFNVTISQQVVNPTASPDSVVIAEIAKGATSDPGNSLDGAKVFMNETVALDKGNGPQHGVITLSNDKGTITSSYWGAVKTEMVDGQPHITTSGDWKSIAGTGIYAKANGKGTYSGGFVSKTDFKGGYKGTLTMP